MVQMFIKKLEEEDVQNLVGNESEWNVIGMSQKAAEIRKVSIPFHGKLLSKRKTSPQTICESQYGKIHAVWFKRETKF